MRYERPDLEPDMLAIVTDAYATRTRTEYARLLEDKEPHDIIVCLGHGRCLYPLTGHAKRLCAFCKVMPIDRAANSSERIRDAVHQLVKGH